MRTLALILLVLLPAPGFALGMADYCGVVRSFGDAASWMTTAFVVGDGSWVVTTSDAVTEKVGPNTTQTIKFPVFISSYSGRSYHCELKALDKDLGVALLKLPASGLPAVTFAQNAEYAKAGFGTMGELMSGEPVGAKWPVTISGITREKKGSIYELTVGETEAGKVFITDIGKYKWMFLSDVDQTRPSPSGSLVMRGSSVVAIYLNKLTITGGGPNASYGRCILTTDVGRFLARNGVDAASLQTPPKPTAKREDTANDGFQLRAWIYSMVGSGKANQAVDLASSLVKIQPDDAEAHVLYAAALTASGKFEDALKQADEAVAMDPKLPMLRVNRALALIGLKKLTDAEAELLKAVDDAPADTHPLIALADFYLADEKTFAKATPYAEKAVTLAPNSPAAHLLLGRAQRRAKQYEASIASIAMAVKMAPTWDEAWYALGSTYEAAGDKANAERAYRKLVEMHPKDPGALLTLASFYVDTGSKDQAAEVIGKIKELNPPKEVLDAVNELENGKTPKGAVPGG